MSGRSLVTDAQNVL
jgi:hypothetical protein